ncbi:hypothetical protein [Psychroserpens ponticola]|uniref:DUF4412 domain-containing protein n=1 Tax=Psychroserpens ponticola TaxID=2932268 RepID=A0ABY7RYR3_9FLAO|nr:hypothetical protein [Psychroserpens ponticola]WCO02178.1 hypothetical protein MUN68_001510 [Psychroserpens ponticola]
MNKRLSLSILILMITTFLAYGQEITFQKNVNYKASTLLQNLNKNRDSLLLESKNKQISQVDIFNENFSQSIDVYSNKTKIDLKTLPVGDFVIQAIVDKNLIIMYLHKNKTMKIASSDQMGNIIVDKEIASNHNANIIGKEENHLYYWVVSESNSNFGSSKSMTLVYREDVAKLISKNKLELKSGVGKDNKLLVYTIYNKSKFMNKQFRNPKYYKSAEESKFFNAEPYYASNNEKEDTSKP